MQQHFWPAKNPPAKGENPEALHAKNKKENAEKKEVKAPPRPLHENDLTYLAALLNSSAVSDASAISDAGPWRLALNFNVELEKSARAKATQPPEATKIAAKPEEPPKLVPLGFAFGPDGTRIRSDKHHIQALLTTRGPACNSSFSISSRRPIISGCPCRDKNLELIQDDPIQPSFLMYHYREFGPDARPVETLGHFNWKPESEPNSLDDEQQAPVSRRLFLERKFASPRPTRSVPGAYHLEMSLAIKDRRKSGEPATFRYQLAGSHGMPVEGEWYVTAPRTAVIGTSTRPQTPLS